MTELEVSRNLAASLVETYPRISGTREPEAVKKEGIYYTHVLQGMKNGGISYKILKILLIGNKLHIM